MPLYERQIRLQSYQCAYWSASSKMSVCQCQRLLFDIYYESDVNSNGRVNSLSSQRAGIKLQHILRAIGSSDSDSQLIFDSLAGRNLPSTSSSCSRSRRQYAYAGMVGAEVDVDHCAQSNDEYVLVADL
ncbi:unnamed protein product [Linum trigynum]|uniref:Uncharacterized protein n=1 Tax=Linum trigynum TaxID=586398 RepID=A0AAV2GSU0_9ROSI